jgi:GH15 family glucan-1,4-alpha-glucosidase
VARVAAPRRRRRCRGCPDHVRVAGERRLDERELEWLSGFERSRPVRVGNEAFTQLQLDVYGELVDAAYQLVAHGSELPPFAWSLLRKLLEWLEDGWRKEDAGIWEVRGPGRSFTHSKVMAWVAFDRAVRLHDKRERDGPVERWRALRDEIHADVVLNAWSARKRAFAQSYGSDELDAAVLLMPLFEFLPATDPRIASTVEALRRELAIDGLLRRYRPDDDGDEGAFLACNFWLAAVLALQGRRDEAHELFERLLGLRNDVGLLAEAYDPRAGRQLGNFPLALTHLGLVTTAITLVEGRPVRRRA